AADDWRGGTRRKHRPENGPRARKFPELFAAFMALLPGHRGLLFVALSTLTISTLIGLAVPAGPKLAIDYVLTDSPGPSGIPAFLGLPQDRKTLLFLLGGGLILLELTSLVIDLVGR